MHLKILLKFKPGSPGFCKLVCNPLFCCKGSQKAAEIIAKTGLKIKETAVASICKSEKGYGCTSIVKKGGLIGGYKIRKRFGDGYNIRGCVEASNAIKAQSGQGPTVEGIIKRKSPAVYDQEELTLIETAIDSKDNVKIEEFIKDNIKAQ